MAGVWRVAAVVLRGLLTAAGLLTIGLVGGEAAAESARPIEALTPEGFHAFGVPSAPVTLTEYSDFL